MTSFSSRLLTSQMITERGFLRLVIMAPNGGRLGLRALDADIIRARRSLFGAFSGYGFTPISVNRVI